MSKLKVMTVVGTRPEIIKLSRVIAELEKHANHILVHTGQNYDYELNEVFFKDLGIRKPDYFLAAAGNNAAETIGQVIIKSDEVFEKEAPDAVLFYGDTNSCLAAISAKRRKIPLFHMEAGNRCFDQRVPEEINRKILDHISDINMTLSEHARRYLINEGLKPETVIKVGSSMKEVFSHYAEGIAQSNVLTSIGLKASDYFIISAHREENVDSKQNLVDLLESLNAVADKYNKKIIFSTHPRTRLRIDALLSENSNIRFDSRIEFMKPFGFCDYIKLMQNAYCVLSDSGSITEDASVLHIPAITIRQAHERPEGMDVGTLLMSGLQKERILQCIDIAVAHHAAGREQNAIVPDYDVNNVSHKVVKIIFSYVDYINRTVWSKH